MPIDFDNREEMNKLISKGPISLGIELAKEQFITALDELIENDDDDLKIHYDGLEADDYDLPDFEATLIAYREHIHYLIEKVRESIHLE